MDEEAQRANEVDRGNKAKVILTDPLFQESFGGVSSNWLYGIRSAILALNANSQ